MKKRLLVLCLLLILLPLCQTVLAIETGPNYEFTITYTADNYINRWWLNQGGTTTLLPTGANRGDWGEADNHTRNLDTTQPNEFIWEVFNYPGQNGGYSPGGFLAEIETTAPIEPDILLASPSWFVALPNSSFTGSNFDVLDWISANSYGTNTDSHPVWSYVAGINDEAEWVWTKNNDKFNFVNNHVLVKTVLDTVPIPSAAWLLGAGLVGMVAVRRKFGNQAVATDMEKELFS